MNIKSITRSVFAATVMVAAAPAQTDHVALEKEGIELIGQLEEVARDVHYNAERLNSFTTTTQITKWSHYHHLDMIASLINEGLRPALTRLEQIKPQLPEWKQESIDKMMSSAVALAGDTNSAILNKRAAGAMPVQLNTQYKDQLARILQHADTLLKTADAAEGFASAQLKAEQAGLKAPKK